MGGGGSTDRQQQYLSLQIQSSDYGDPIPLGWGRARVAINLIWFDGFKSVEVKKSESGGKGGSETSISYNYFADLELGICDTANGPIRGVNQIFRDKSVFSNGATSAVAQAGFAGVALGASGQAAWTWLDNYPDAKLGYDTTAYLYASQYQLNSDAGLQNHTVEVDFAMQVGNGIVDANPGDYNGQKGIVSDFLTGCIPQWNVAYIGDLSGYGIYCLAAGLLLSPCLDSQVQASSFLDELMLASNSECWVRGDGTLQVTPLADATVSGNGATYTPDLTPIYDLTSDDFIVTDPGDDPLQIDTENLDDLYNVVQVSFQNREHQYNDETVTGFDQASVDEFGQRKQDPTEIDSIKDPTVARLVAQLLVQKTANFARPFVFNLPWWADRLEETDLITVSNESQGIYRVLCRIEEIDEDQDTGMFTIHATEVLIGTANAPVYPAQSANGVVTDFEADPGDVSAPVMFIPPTMITNDALEVWCAVSSTNANWGGAYTWVSLDGTNYSNVGPVTAAARYGFTTKALASRPDPDTKDTLQVDLSTSDGVLTNATAADYNAFATLCWLGGELVAYENAALTSAGFYNLTNLRRGGYGTSVAQHPIGTPFVRLDNAVFKYTFLSAQIGQTIYVKFTSFNVFGKQVQALSDVTEYTLVLEQPGIISGATSLALQSPWASDQFTLVASASDNTDNYTFQIYEADGVTLVHQSNPTAATSFTYTASMAASDGNISRTYVGAVIPSNDTGDGPVATLAVNNPAPSAVKGLSKSGSDGSVTYTWTANSESDLAGYVAYYSQTSGFDPTQGAGELFYDGQGTSASLSGLTTSPATTYYVRVAAYDTWSDDVSTLNFSAQVAFTT